FASIDDVHQPDAKEGLKRMPPPSEGPTSRRPLHIADLLGDARLEWARKKLSRHAILLTVAVLLWLFIGDAKLNGLVLVVAFTGLQTAHAPIGCGGCGITRRAWTCRRGWIIGPRMNA